MAKLDYYTQVSKEKLRLSEKPFASGGEGALYAITSPRNYRHLVAKLYYPNKRDAEREKKMRYLLENPPDIKKSNEQPEAAWLVDIIYADRQFVGVLMPKIRGDKLTMLCLAKLPRKASKAWKRFAFGTPKALELRLKTCFNIAMVIHQIHRTGKYVLVDLKPDNILMQSNGLVALVDMDSVQVVENEEAIFLAPVATPEYTPPEYYKNDERTKAISWDNFSMGVIFYQLLFGLHPFAATAKAPYDKMVALHEKIEQGLYVHHRKFQHIFQVVPPPHLRFKHLPLELKELFARCFELGQQPIEDRPTAADWGLALGEVLGLNINMPDILGPNNLHLKPSPYYKSPFDLADKGALLWEHPKLDLVSSLSAVKTVDEMTEIDVETLQKKELKRIWTSYEQLLDAAKAQQYTDFTKEVKRRKDLKKKQNEDNQSAWIGCGIFAIFIFPGLIIPAVIFFFLYLMKKVLFPDEEKELKLEDIPLRNINMNSISKALHGVGSLTLNIRMNNLVSEVQSRAQRLSNHYSKLLDEQKERDTSEEAQLWKVVHDFEPKIEAYNKSLDALELELRDLYKATKALHEEEAKTIKEQLDLLVQNADFEDYNAENYKDLHRLLKKIIAKAEEEIKTVIDIKEKIKIKETFAEASKLLNVLEERCTQILETTHNANQSKHLELQNKAIKAYDLVLAQRNILERDYKARRKKLDKYNLANSKFNTLMKSYLAEAKELQDKKTERLKLDTLKAWETHFDEKIAVEDLLGNKIKIMDAILLEEKAR